MTKGKGKGKGKGKSKSKGKGNKGRYWFRSHAGQSGKSKGHADYGKDGKGKGKSKGKGKAKGKGKTGSEEEHAHAAGDASGNGQGGYADQTQTSGEPARTQETAATSTYDPSFEQWSWSDDYGWWSSQWNEDWHAGYVHHTGLAIAEYPTKYTLITQVDSWNHIDMRNNPLYVILDIGCTKAMGSRHAVNAFCSACADTHITYEFLPTKSYFSFANSNQTVVWEKCRLWFSTDPPVYTDIDICEEGTVPILMSLPQLRNLYFTIRMTPHCVYLTCPSFGYDDTPAQMATSNHIVLNMADFKVTPTRNADNQPWKGPSRVSEYDSFLTVPSEQEALVASKLCPACRGLHRKHTCGKQKDALKGTPEQKDCNNPEVSRERTVDNKPQGSPKKNDQTSRRAKEA